MHAATVSAANNPPKPSILSLALSPDGTVVAAGDSLGNITLRRVADGAWLATLTVHTRAIYSLAFSPDGRTLATGSNDGSIAVWDLWTEEELGSLRKDGDWT